VEAVGAEDDEAALLVDTAVTLLATHAADAMAAAACLRDSERVQCELADF